MTPTLAPAPVNTIRLRHRHIVVLAVPMKPSGHGGESSCLVGHVKLGTRILEDAPQKAVLAVVHGGEEVVEGVVV